MSTKIQRIGIICPSEIAFRRFLPALQKANNKIIFTAIGIASPEEWFGDLNGIAEQHIANQQLCEKAKAQKFVDLYGGKIFYGYKNLISSDDIDAVYIPLPPALHYKWAKFALEKNKHVFIEKPSTIQLKDTESLIQLASEKGLALHENYMFVYHKQLQSIEDVIKNGNIGDIRLYRITFGFPLRELKDFRYNKELGGGALLDAGGYCMKYADYLLGHTAKIVAAQANYINGFEVDMYGNATMVNDEGTTAQIAFGMDNDYQCKIEIWGSKGTLISDRILTAPAGFTPQYTLKKNQDLATYPLPEDDAFLSSIERFVECINNENIRKEEYQLMHRQETLVEDFKTLSKMN